MIPMQTLAEMFEMEKRLKDAEKRAIEERRRVGNERDELEQRICNAAIEAGAKPGAGVSFLFNGKAYQITGPNSDGIYSLWEMPEFVTLSPSTYAEVEAGITPANPSISERAEQYRKALTEGSMSVNECRAAEGLPPIDTPGANERRPLPGVLDVFGEAEANASTLATLIEGGTP